MIAVADPKWIRRETVKTVAAQPLVLRGEALVCLFADAGGGIEDLLPNRIVGDFMDDEHVLHKRIYTLFASAMRVISFKRTSPCRRPFHAGEFHGQLLWINGVDEREVHLGS